MFMRVIAVALLICGIVFALDVVGDLAVAARPAASPASVEVAIPPPETPAGRES